MDIKPGARRAARLLTTITVCLGFFLSAALKADAWYFRRPALRARNLVARAAAGGPIANSILSKRFPWAAQALANGDSSSAAQMVRNRIILRRWRL